MARVRARHPYWIVGIIDPSLRRPSHESAMHPRRARLGAVVLLLLGCATPSQGIRTAPAAPESASPAHVARRQMLARAQARRPTSAVTADTSALGMSAVDVLGLMARVGRDSTDRLLFGDSARSTLCGLPVLDSIATGDSSWLEVARRLLPRRDLCSTYGVRQALQEALGKAPRRVLSLVVENADVDFDWTCASMISDDLEHRDRMDALNAAHAAAVAAALAQVRDPAVAKLRDACVSRLRKPTARLPEAPTGDAAADTILRLFAREGAAAALRHASPDGLLRPAYRSRIASGDVEWVYIAGALATAAELVPSVRYGFNSAWGYYDLIDAMTDALVSAPEVVFESLIDHPSVPLQWVCSGGANDHTDEHRRLLAERRARALEPVSSIAPEEYRAMRDACVARLRR